MIHPDIELVHHRAGADGVGRLRATGRAVEHEGGVLIDEKGRITGMAHTSRPIKDGPDLFLPIETAMKSLGVGICGKEFPQPKPKPQKSWRQKSVAPLIENTVQKAPEAMDVKERK